MSDSSSSEYWASMICELRRRSGLTQQAFARLLEVAQSTVARWEERRAIPSRTNQIRIQNLIKPETNAHLEIEEFYWAGMIQTLRFLSGRTQDDLAQELGVAADVGPLGTLPPKAGRQGRLGGLGPGTSIRS